VDALCLARTGWAEWRRYTRLRLSLAHSPVKTLRRVSRAGRLAQFQFLCAEWGLSSQSTVHAAQYTSHVPLFEWAVRQGWPDADPMNFLPEQHSHNFHSWALLRHYYYRSLPLNLEDDIAYILESIDQKAQAAFLEYLATLPLQSRQVEEILARFTASNRHVTDPVPMLERVLHEPREWNAFLNEALENHNLPVLIYLLQVKKMGPLDLGRVFRNSLGNMKRARQLALHLHAHYNVPWPRDFIFAYLYAVAKRQRMFHAPFNLAPCLEFVKQGLSVSESAICHHYTACLAAMQEPTLIVCRFG
jgi:hypothetical protein